jgi:CHASE3 domain sensor protein
VSLRLRQRLNRRPLVHWLGPAAVVLGVLVFIVNEAGYRATQSLGAQREAALRAHQQVVQIRSLVAQAEAAQRGYVLTGRSDYLGPYDATQQELARSLDAARALAARQPDQGETLARLVELTERRISEMQEVMRLHGEGGPAAAIELMLTDIGREHMSAIDDLAGLVSVVEAEALQRAEGLQARVQAASRAGVALLLAASLLAVYLMLRLVRQRDDERRAHLRELTAERDKFLEAQVERARVPIFRA